MRQKSIARVSAVTTRVDIPTSNGDTLDRWPDRGTGSKPDRNSEAYSNGILVSPADFVSPPSVSDAVLTRASRI